MTQTNLHPEKLSACCNAPTRLVGGRGDFRDSDVAVTMHYECTSCNQPCDLSSTDSPETYYTDPPYNLDEIQQCNGCGMAKHVDSKGYCGRCNAPVEPDELDKLFDFAINAKQASLDFAAEAELFGDTNTVLATANARLDYFRARFNKEIAEYVAKQVDAAVAEARLDEFAVVNGIWGQCSEVGTKEQALKIRRDLIERQEQLKKKDNKNEKTTIDSESD